MAYTYTIERLTVGDYARLCAASEARTLSGLLAVIDKAIDGGLEDVPLSEMAPVIEGFGVALAAFLEAQDEAQTPDAIKLIRKALGEGL